MDVGVAGGEGRQANKMHEQNTVCGSIDIKLCMCICGRAHKYAARKIGLSTLDC